MGREEGVEERRGEGERSEVRERRGKGRGEGKAERTRRRGLGQGGILFSKPKSIYHSGNTC